MFSKTSLMFKNDNSDTFHPVKRVRQGDPLSPTLFLTVFNVILDLLPEDTGFLFEDTIINHMAYADDLVLMAENTDQLQHLLNIL